MRKFRKTKSEEGLLEDELKQNETEQMWEEEPAALEEEPPAALEEEPLVALKEELPVRTSDSEDTLPLPLPLATQPESLIMLQTASKAFISNKHRAPKARKYLPTRTKFS